MHVASIQNDSGAGLLLSDGIGGISMCKSRVGLYTVTGRIGAAQRCDLFFEMAGAI
jgi:hypothetical protein